MSRLSYDELLSICRDKKIEVMNILNYENLQSVLSFKCKKCGKEFDESFENIRNKNWFCKYCNSQSVTKTYKPPKKNGYRIIGCDQATQKFGISVFDNGKLVYYDCFEFNGELDKRYADIMTFMNNVAKTWEPDMVIIEDIQLQQGAIGGYNAFKVLGGLLGIMKAVLAKNNIPHKEVLNKVWQAKFMIAGKDRSTQKKNVIKKVKELFGIDVSDDIADAILIGKWGVSESGNRINVDKLF